MTDEELLKQYGPALARVAASYAPPGSLRDDLQQEMAIAVLGALPRWRGESSMLTYVYRIAHRCGMAMISTLDDIEDVDVDAYPHPASGPEALLSQQQRYEQLAYAIRQLPLSLRQPMTLRLEGLSYEEIGQILEISVNVVGVRLHRATTTLKTLMKQEG